MANSYNTNPIYLDTFTTTTDVATNIGVPDGAPLFIDHIRWVAGSAGDTAELMDGPSGKTVFYSEADAGLKDVAYFHGEMVKNIYIASAGVEAGKIFILLSRNKGG